jgi:hypothetical protein
MQLIQDQKKAAVAKAEDDAKALIQAKRNDFNQKIQMIGDQKKKALVEQIDTKLAYVNKNLTTKYIEALNNLQGFLDKASKAGTGSANLIDITAAQAAIDAAKAAVTDQAAKVYTMTIIDQTTLKFDAGDIVSQLRTDLTAVYKLVIAAKQAVQKLYPGKSDIKKEATKSAEL